MPGLIVKRWAESRYHLVGVRVGLGVGEDEDELRADWEAMGRKMEM